MAREGNCKSWAQERGGGWELSVEFRARRSQMTLMELCWPKAGGKGSGGCAQFL